MGGLYCITKIMQYKKYYKFVVMNQYTNNEATKAHIIALEKQALEMWNNGNPDGFINLSSEDVVYIDPAFENELECTSYLKNLLHY